MIRTSSFFIASTTRLTDSKSPKTVIESLSKNFNLSPETAKALVEHPKTVKKGLSLEKAKHYKSAFLKCGLIVEIIEENSSAQKVFEHNIKLDTLKNQISETLQRETLTFQTSLTYKLGLFLTLILSLITPLLYLCLIGLTGFTSYWLSFNIHSFSWFQDIPIIFQASLYIAIIFIGAVFSLFLLRPLFFQNTKQPGRIRLDSKKAPLLFHLVDELCCKFNQPAPSEIYVSNDINAYVASKKGLTALLRKDLTLTLGLPLIATMNARQLVGVLSHEFGHFTQRSAMITHYIINSVSYWLGTRIYCKDPLEERLNRWKELENHFAFLCWITLKFISLSRRILKQFYNTNLFISRWMSRQMEYDADKYECYISGSDYFENTALALWEAHYGFSETRQLRQRIWNANKLLNNLPHAIAEETRKLPSEAKSDIQEEMKTDTHEWWSSHPADLDRIRHAKSLNLQPIWTSEHPAKDFFADFEQLCLAITNSEYRLKGYDQSQTSLITYEQAIQEKKLEQEELKALKEFMPEQATYRCLFFPTPLPKPLSSPSDVSATIQLLEENKDKWLEAENKYWEGRGTTSEAIYAKLLFEANILQPGDDDDEYQNVADCDKKIAASSRQWYTATNELKSIDKILAQRITNAARFMTEAEKSQLKKQIAFFRFLEKTDECWLDLRRYTWILEELFEEDEIFEEELTPIVLRYKKFTKEALDNFTSAASKLQIEVNNHPLKPFSWWFEEWIERYDPSHEYTVGHLHHIAEQTENLIFYLIKRISASMAYNCLQAEKRALKEPQQIKEIALS